MKKILLLFLVLLLSSTVLMACESGNTTESTEPETPGVGDVVDGKLILAKDGVAYYDVIYRYGAQRDEDFVSAMGILKQKMKDWGVNEYTQQYDKDSKPKEYEILLGRTDRPESQVFRDMDKATDLIVRVVGKKVIVGGSTDSFTAQALLRFLDTCVVVENNTVAIPVETDATFPLDLGTCTATGKTYLEMAGDVWNSFNKKYFIGGWVQGSGWWDAAEILETYVDAYEATKDSDIRKKMLQYATRFKARNGTDWAYNEFNDDIMWACIAFCRISLLTGDKSYYEIARSNFDTVYERALDNKLGGGLYWKSPANDTKNSCVNCPASIAACLLGELSGDEAYFERARSLMNWEFTKMFNKTSGAVYDAYPLQGNKSTWASTYNQGTFIGACTLLAKHYSQEADTYLDYASKAADYAMKNLTTGGILNGEASMDNNDLPGFKGILTRWLYRYAKYTDNVDILMFLQKNAATAYSNRNDKGLIWTAWKEETNDDVSNYHVFGMSTAVALMFNSLPWWN